MRCGTRLVSTGDGKDKVRKLCGEPSDVSVVGMQSTPRYYYRYYDRYGRLDRRYYDSFYEPAWIDVPVEIWTYNFGSSRLLRKLRFVGDELDEIRTDGYGY